MDYRKVLIRPLYTEKMSFLEETQRKYAFQVEDTANKIQIKRAVEEKFDVKVETVTNMNRKDKAKKISFRSGGRAIQTTGFQSSWKRAVITLKEGFTIDLIKGEAQV